MKNKQIVNYIAVLVLILAIYYQINYSIMSMIGAAIGSCIAILFIIYDNIFLDMSVKLKNNILSIFKNYVIPFAMIIALLYNTKSSLELLSDSIFSFMAYNFLFYFWERSDQEIIKKKQILKIAEK